MMDCVRDILNQDGVDSATKCTYIMMFLIPDKLTMEDIHLKMVALATRFINEVDKVIALILKHWLKLTVNVSTGDGELDKYIENQMAEIPSADAVLKGAKSTTSDDKMSGFGKTDILMDKIKGTIAKKFMDPVKGSNIILELLFPPVDDDSGHEMKTEDILDELDTFALYYINQIDALRKFFVKYWLQLTGQVTTGNKEQDKYVKAYISGIPTAKMILLEQKPTPSTAKFKKRAEFTDANALIEKINGIVANEKMTPKKKCNEIMAVFFPEQVEKEVEPKSNVEIKLDEMKLIVLDNIAGVDELNACFLKHWLQLNDVTVENDALNTYIKAYINKTLTAEQTLNGSKFSSREEFEQLSAFKEANVLLVKITNIFLSNDEPTIKCTKIMALLLPGIVEEEVTQMSHNEMKLMDIKAVVEKQINNVDKLSAVILKHWLRLQVTVTTGNSDLDQYIAGYVHKMPNVIEMLKFMTESGLKFDTETDFIQVNTVMEQIRGIIDQPNVDSTAKCDKIMEILVSGTRRKMQPKIQPDSGEQKKKKTEVVVEFTLPKFTLPSGVKKGDKSKLAQMKLLAEKEANTIDEIHAVILKHWLQLDGDVTKDEIDVTTWNDGLDRYISKYTAKIPSAEMVLQGATTHPDSKFAKEEKFSQVNKLMNTIQRIITKPDTIPSKKCAMIIGMLLSRPIEVQDESLFADDDDNDESLSKKSVPVMRKGGGQYGDGSKHAKMVSLAMKEINNVDVLRRSVLKHWLKLDIIVETEDENKDEYIHHYMIATPDAKQTLEGMLHKGYVFTTDDAFVDVNNLIAKIRNLIDDDRYEPIRNCDDVMALLLSQQKPIVVADVSDGDAVSSDSEDVLLSEEEIGENVLLNNDTFYYIDQTLIKLLYGSVEYAQDGMYDDEEVDIDQLFHMMRLFATAIILASGNPQEKKYLLNFWLDLGIDRRSAGKIDNNDKFEYKMFLRMYPTALEVLNGDGITEQLQQSDRPNVQRAMQEIEEIIDTHDEPRTICKNMMQYLIPITLTINPLTKVSDHEIEFASDVAQKCLNAMKKNVKYAMEGMYSDVDIENDVLYMLMRYVAKVMIKSRIAEGIQSVFLSVWLNLCKPPEDDISELKKYIIYRSSEIPNPLELMRGDIVLQGAVAFASRFSNVDKIFSDIFKILKKSCSRESCGQIMQALLPQTLTTNPFNEQLTIRASDGASSTPVASHTVEPQPDSDTFSDVSRMFGNSLAQTTPDVAVQRTAPLVIDGDIFSDVSRVFGDGLAQTTPDVSKTA